MLQKCARALKACFQRVSYRQSVYHFQQSCCDRSYLFPWAQSLHGACELVQSGIGALKKAVDNVNDAGPVAFDILYIAQGRTYVVRVCCRRAEKATRKREKARILGVQGRAERWVDGPVKGEIFSSKRGGTACGIDKGGLNGCLKARKVVHDGACDMC
jgi:hypothetical protein